MKQLRLVMLVKDHLNSVEGNEKRQTSNEDSFSRESCTVPYSCIVI